MALGLRTQLVAVDPRHAVATVGPLAINVWRGDVQSAALGKALEAQRAVMRDFPGEGVAVHVVEVVAPPPSSEARDGFLKLIKVSGEGLKCVAVIAEGEGFAVSMVRTVVAGMTILVRPAVPMKVFSTVPDASKWILTLRKSTDRIRLSAEEIADAAEKIRKSIPVG